MKYNAIGSDNISRRMILLTLNFTLPTLCHIFITTPYSLSSSDFADTWHNALVLPVPKISNPTSFANYPPISILPFFSKVFERIVHEQIYLYNNNILTSFQSDFRPGHSDIKYIIDN